MKTRFIWLFAYIFTPSRCFCTLIADHSLAVTWRIARGAVRAQSKLSMTPKIECSCVYDVQWTFIQFHPERRWSIKRYLHCFFPSPLLKTTFVTVRVVIPLGTSLCCISSLKQASRSLSIEWQNVSQLLNDCTNFSSFGAAKITWHHKAFVLTKIRNIRRRLQSTRVYE